VKYTCAQNEAKLTENTAQPITTANMGATTTGKAHMPYVEYLNNC